MIEHIRREHPGYSPNGIEAGIPIPPDLAAQMYITTYEEARLGVPADKIPMKMIPPGISDTVDEPPKQSTGKRKRSSNNLAEGHAQVQQKRMRV